MPVDPTTDKDFMAAPPHEQMAYLSQTDPEFAKASPQDQMGYLMHIRGLSPNISGPAKPNVNMQPSNLGIAMGSENTGKSAIFNPQQPGEQFALEHPEEQGKMALMAGIGAVGAAGSAVAPVVLPAIKAMAQAHPILSTMLASEAISQARNIPYVGKMIPPYSEMIPMLLGGRGGKPATEGAPPETIWDKPPNVPVERPAPLWQQQGVQPTQPGFNWQTSTPEEVQAQLQRMANRPKATRMEGQPAPEVQTIPVKPITQPVQPPFPGPKDYEVVRGTDPFTHPNAPGKWQFDQDYSTNVKQYGYHPDSQTISVMYKRGGVYQFKATPQMFNEMTKAPSAGAYLHDVIEPAQNRGVGTHIGTVRELQSPGKQAKTALGQARGQQ